MRPALDAITDAIIRARTEGSDSTYSPPVKARALVARAGKRQVATLVGASVAKIGCLCNISRVRTMLALGLFFRSERGFVLTPQCHGAWKHFARCLEFRETDLVILGVWRGDVRFSRHDWRVDRAKSEIEDDRSPKRKVREKSVRTNTARGTTRTKSHRPARSGDRGITGPTGARPGPGVLTDRQADNSARQRVRRTPHGRPPKGWLSDSIGRGLAFARPFPFEPPRESSGGWRYFLARRGLRRRAPRSPLWKRRSRGFWS
jgi:hypothetical protein